MISRTKPASIKTFGAFEEGPGTLQPSVHSTRNTAGYQLTLEWEGDYAVLAAFQGTAACAAGAITLPQSLTLVDGAVKIKLIDSDLAGDVGFTGLLRNTYVLRNDREIDVDMNAGLVSRQISMQWIERQEQIELFAARLNDEALGTFNPVLLEMWRNEECADVKAEFNVRLFTEVSEGGTRAYLKTVALDNNDGEIPVSLKGSLLTKAVAQRIAQGVEYVGKNNIQIVAAEIWRVAPTLEYQCNQILTSGIPEIHRPLFHMPVPTGTTFSWMRMSDFCSQTDAGAYARTITYMGIENSMMPNPLPQSWGETPFDGLMYKTAAV